MQTEGKPSLTFGWKVPESTDAHQIKKIILRPVYTVEGELCVAKFIDNFFKRAPLPDTMAVHPYLVVPKGTARTNHQV